MHFGRLMLPEVFIGGRYTLSIFDKSDVRVQTLILLHCIWRENDVRHNGDLV